MGADIGGALGGILGSWLGFAGGQGDRDAAGQDYQNGVNAWNGALGYTAPASAFNSIHVDPQTRSDQLAALGQLKDVYANQGMDPAMRNKLNQEQSSNALQARAMQGQIQNSMAQQGLASSGSNFAAQQQAAQQAAQNNYNQGMGAASLGSQRQMEALQAAGGLASNMRGMDYQQASNQAEANDAISRFNAQQQQQAQQERAKGLNNAYDNQAQWNAGLANQWQQMGAGTGQAAGAFAGKVANGGLGSFMGGGNGGGNSSYGNYGSAPQEV